MLAEHCASLSLSLCTVVQGAYPAAGMCGLGEGRISFRRRAARRPKTLFSRRLIAS
jgi:hypothetical protein